MRSLLLIVLVLWTLNLLYAGELPFPPPLKDEPAAEQEYLREIYRNHNNFVVVTTTPNGNRQGRIGDQVYFNSSGSYRVCVNTDAGPAGGTTWVCSANVFAAP